MKTLFIIKVFIAFSLMSCSDNTDPAGPQQTAGNQEFFKQEKGGRRYPFRLPSYGDFRSAYLKAHGIKKNEDC